MPDSESSLTTKAIPSSKTSLSTAEGSKTRLLPPINLTFPYAAQPDIIISNQKDVYYQKVLEEQFSEVFRILFGTRKQHLYQKEVNLMSDLFYFCLTTLLGTQTLGEEYCDIMQISESTKKVPIIRKRATLIFWHVIFPYFYTKGINKIRRNARSVPKVDYQVQDNPSNEHVKLREFVRNSVTKIQSFFKNHFHTLHLAIFYFYGAYYDLSKRIFTKQLGPGEQRIGYEVLGFLLAVQILIQAYLYQKKRTEDSS
ncbi:10043_t:CDS:2, partial [Acaulospora morrowiae]